MVVSTSCSGPEKRCRSLFWELHSLSIIATRTERRSLNCARLAGAILGHPFNAGFVVTNTTFSPDAEWYAREHAKLIRLRGFDDIRRWVCGNFTDEAEWREVKLIFSGLVGT